MASTDASSALAATIGENLRAARKAAGLTQRELALRLGRGDVMAVSRWERAEHRPSDANLIALAEALELPVAWFVTDHESVAA